MRRAVHSLEAVQLGSCGARSASARQRADGGMKLTSAVSAFSSARHAHSNAALLVLVLSVRCGGSARTSDRHSLGQFHHDVACIVLVRPGGGALHIRRR